VAINFRAAGGSTGAASQLIADGEI
jgi:hypothetical protein